MLGCDGASHVSSTFDHSSPLLSLSSLQASLYCQSVYLTLFALFSTLQFVCLRSEMKHGIFSLVLKPTHSPPHHQR